jgi:hypothetical protein
MTTPHDVGGVFGRPLDTFGLSLFHSHGSWLMCEMALMGAQDCLIFKVRLSANDLVKGRFVTLELEGPWTHDIQVVWLVG